MPAAHQPTAPAKGSLAENMKRLQGEAPGATTARGGLAANMRRLLASGRVG